MAREPPSARELKAQLRQVFDTIAVLPHAAPVYIELERRTIRRRPVKKTPYSVFYFVDDEREEAVVISIWSMERGERPPL